MTTEFALGILVGILIWQTFILILSQFNFCEDTILAVALCFWLPVVKILNFTIRKMKLLWSRRYNCYQFFGQVSTSKRDDGIDRWICNFYMTPKMAKRFKVVNKDEKPGDYTIKLLRTGKEFKSAPVKYEIITEKTLKTGFSGYSPDFFKKFTA